MNTVATAALAFTVPELQAGETWAGIAFADGKPSHHLILLPGEEKAIAWRAAGAWAEKQGGALPTRKEQALLFANLPGEFQRDWYWSSEQYAGDESYAWCQDFDGGIQSSGRKSLELRARAVRRLPIQ